jgi:hypothetical protein
MFLEILTLCRYSMEQINKFKGKNTAVFKNESSFTGWLGKMINTDWWFFYKISDESSWHKPFDCIISYQWFICACEIKYTKHWSCYPFQMLRGSSPKNPWSQVISLTNWQKNGWKSIVIVYSAKKNTFCVLDFAGLAFNSHLTFSWDTD